MDPTTAAKLSDVNAITAGFAELDYICSRSIATALFIAANLGKPLLESRSKHLKDGMQIGHHVSRGDVRPHDPVPGAFLQFDQTTGRNERIQRILVFGPHSELPGLGQMGGI